MQARKAAQWDRVDSALSAGPVLEQSCYTTTAAESTALCVSLDNFFCHRNSKKVGVLMFQKKKTFSSILSDYKRSTQSNELIFSVYE